MKKFIYLLSIICLLLISTNVLACDPFPGVEYSTVDSLLSKNDTAIALYKVINGGQEAKAQLIIGNENTKMNIDLRVDKTSCGVRSNDFVVGEYIVSIFNKSDIIINYSKLDGQFSFSFDNQEDAINKYSEFIKKWDERNKLLKDVPYDEKDVIFSSTNYSLKPGMKNDDVLALQTALKIKLKLGEDFKLDGSYGPATIKAVKQFQVSEELEDDGIAGVLTQSKLSNVVINNGIIKGDKKDNLDKGKDTSYSSTNYSLKPGMKNDDVLALQTALKIKLKLGEDFKLDGSYGPATIKAVKQFQVSEELEDDGIAGVLTQSKLSNVVIKNINKDDSEGTVQGEEKTIDNSDTSDADLKRILIRAKNEIIYYAVNGKSYTDAYELVSGYNNTFLDIYSNSDPLYKSSGGGLYFVYSLKLSNGEYICADNNFRKEITQKTTRPNTNVGQVSC